jgi:hypothetical protein
MLHRIETFLEVTTMHTMLNELMLIIFLILLLVIVDGIFRLREVLDKTKSAKLDRGTKGDHVAFSVIKPLIP